jgi:hypothetical protein
MHGQTNIKLTSFYSFILIKLVNIDFQARSGINISAGARDFSFGHKRPDRPKGPGSPVFSGYQKFFPRSGKAAGPTG